MPNFVKPQVPVLVADVPAGPEWVHEIKHDGYRILAYVERGTVRLVGPHRRDWSGRFAGVRGALDRLKVSEVILDGEIAAPDAEGVTPVAYMRAAMAREPERIVYYVFDLLWLDGRDLRPLPLLQRKAHLKTVIRPALRGRVLFSEHVQGAHGPVFYTEATAIGCEGIVSKRVDAPYKSGPGRTWLKVKPAEIRQRQAESVGRAMQRKRGVR